MNILLVNQGSILKTGYGVFGKFLLDHLSINHNVAELACDVRQDDVRLNQVKWKVYGNLPTNEQEQQIFNQNHLSVYGANIFDRVCLDFKPDIIISINDIWAASYIAKHPYKRFYNFVWMPTLDAEGISKEWLYELSLVDKILTYQGWSNKQLTLESKKLVSLGDAPFIPDNKNLYPIKDRKKLKENCGIKGIILGTVMRNQARKRFPELFSAFSRILKTNPNVNLYCHCSYPDNQGWNIPALLLKNQISNNVYFSYICQNCNFIWPSTYRDISFCPRCKQKSGIMCNARHSMPIENMNIMYNLFDVYIQFMSAEGLGMPVLEAAACGTPIVSNNYASLIDIIPKVRGIGIKNILYQEITSDRLMAAPDPDDLVEKINHILKTTDLDEWREDTYDGYVDNYNLSESLNVWDQAINSCEKKNPWNSPPNFYPLPQFREEMNHMKNSEFIKWCILNILKEPEKIGTLFETQLISQLDFGARVDRTVTQINKEQIFQEFLTMRQNINYLEQKRVS